MNEPLHREKATVEGLDLELTLPTAPSPTTTHLIELAAMAD